MGNAVDVLHARSSLLYPVLTTYMSKHSMILGTSS